MSNKIQGFIVRHPVAFQIATQVVVMVVVTVAASLVLSGIHGTANAIKESFEQKYSAD